MLPLGQNAYTLLQHQQDDVYRLLENMDTPNFSGVGTGKTITTLEALRLNGAKQVVVVCPPIAVAMWVENIERHFDLEAMTVTSKNKAKFLSPLAGKPDVYFLVTSYGMLLNKEVLDKLDDWGGDALVLDESDMLSNRQAKRTQAVYGSRCEGVEGIWAAFSKCMTLTGTPIPNHPDGLWSQLRAGHVQALMQHDVLDYEAFRNKYTHWRMVKPHPRAYPQVRVSGSRNLDDLHVLLHDTIGVVRRVISDVDTAMPELTTTTLPAVLSVSAKDKELNAELRKAMQTFPKGAEAELGLAKLLETGDAGVAKAWRIVGLLKVNSVAEHVVRVAASGPVLVGYWHTDVGDAIEDRVAESGLSVRRIMGKTPMARREEIRLAFNAGTIDVLVGQMSAMATAINLQGAGSRIVVAEEHPSARMLEQFIARIYRMGQKNHTHVDYMTSEQKLDKALANIRNKKAIATSKVL